MYTRVWITHGYSVSFNFNSDTAIDLFFLIDSINNTENVHHEVKLFPSKPWNKFILQYGCLPFHSQFESSPQSHVLLPSLMSDKKPVVNSLTEGERKLYRS